jgi:hypothetical protein
MQCKLPLLQARRDQQSILQGFLQGMVVIRSARVAPSLDEQGLHVQYNDIIQTPLLLPLSRLHQLRELSSPGDELIKRPILRYCTTAQTEDPITPPHRLYRVRDEYCRTGLPVSSGHLSREKEGVDSLL